MVGIQMGLTDARFAEVKIMFISLMRQLSLAVLKRMEYILTLGRKRPREKLYRGNTDSYGLLVASESRETLRQEVMTKLADSFEEFLNTFEDMRLPSALNLVYYAILKTEGDIFVEL